MSYEKSLIDSKQDDLISGTNIKTINGSSILGSGDLVVTGGGISDGDYGDITVSSSGTVWNIDAATVGVTELSATGTPSATTFLRGDNTWAAPTSVDPAGWTNIIKSANQDTGSNVLSDLTGFNFSVVAGGMYVIEMDVYYGCASSGTDIGIALNVSAGVMSNGRVNTMRNQSNSTVMTPPAVFNSINTQTVFSSGQANDISNPHFLKIYAVFTTSANATFKMQHRAQSNGFTVRTMKGTLLKYKKIN